MTAALGLIQLAVSFFALSTAVIMHQNGVVPIFTTVVAAMLVSHGLHNVLVGDE